MLQAVHVLLSYSCTSSCDHCFLHCSPGAGRTFSQAGLKLLFGQMRDVAGLRAVSFEGGEPFLFHPLLRAGLELARDAGLEADVVTNAYWAEHAEDAGLWLDPLVEAGLAGLAVSSDELHHAPGSSLAANAMAAAENLGIPAYALSLELPRVKDGALADGGIMFRGRAAEELTRGLPARPAQAFDACPWEDLDRPSRVHVDADGNVQVCQGVSIGNCLRSPLAEILAAYDPGEHPLCGPLLRGGPAQLMAEHGLEPNAAGYVDACHCCYAARKALLGRLPRECAPLQAYGMSAKE